jgi:hypothetical protein
LCRAAGLARRLRPGGTRQREGCKDEQTGDEHEILLFGSPPPARRY